MQPTLENVSDYITDARVLLQDQISPYRYDDTSLITALNVTLLEALRLRADLFVYETCGCGGPNGQVQSFTTGDLTSETPVDIEAPFRLAILHGLVGHALERDQEDYQDVRATSFLGIFNDMLMGTAIRPLVGGSPPQ